jgi:hypothetical protein
MGLILNKGVAPGQIGLGKGELYFDSTIQRLCFKDSDTSQVSFLQSTGLDRNYIINGSHFFAQRQAPGTLTTYSTTTGRNYAADRWGITNENASVQYQRVDTLGGVETGLASRSYGRYKKITNAGKMVVSQFVEGISSANLRGGIVRVQAKMRYSVAASMTVRLGLVELQAAGTIDTVPATFISGAVGTDPTLGTNLAYIAPIAGTAEGTGGTIIGNGLTCVLTSAWTRFSANFTVPTTSKNLAVVIWTNGQPAALDELNISEVGLYDSADIHDWAEMPMSTELQMCQRFCCKSFAVDTAPAQNAGVVGCISGIAGKAGATALAGKIWVGFPTTMRGLPTVTIYCPTEASAQIDRIDGTTPIAHTATAQLHLGDGGVFVTSTGTTNTAVGDTIALHYLASAEL